MYNRVVVLLVAVAISRGDVCECWTRRQSLLALTTQPHPSRWPALQRKSLIQGSLELTGDGDVTHETGQDGYRFYRVMDLWTARQSSSDPVNPHVSSRTTRHVSNFDYSTLTTVGLDPVSEQLFVQ